MNVLVTGAAGFIGSNLVHHLRKAEPAANIVSYDLLTYAGNLENLATLREDPKHTFVQADIRDRKAVASAIREHAITHICHLAAESHVDRSIADPLTFIRTNVEGTAVLLHEATEAWSGRTDVRFLHVSTDEVFGELGDDGRFSESTPYSPRSPYSASKAASDHLVRAWHETYGLPTLVTNCTNNYGPFQFPEKLIPVVLTRALSGEPVPVYGQGTNVRDWLFVEDHCSAILSVLRGGRVGHTYCVGGDEERSNLELVHMLLDELDRQLQRAEGTGRALIEFVKDRPGHDFRYAMDAGKMKSELGWRPAVSLVEGLSRTVSWYLEHPGWCERVASGEHRSFQAAWYADRGGKR